MPVSRGTTARSFTVELVIIARFRASEGHEAAVAAAIRVVVPQSRAEPGCVSIAGYRSTRDPRLHWIYSRWVDEAAFELHATLPHTVHFIAHVRKLIDHPLEVTRNHPIA
jgi:quinol monooxygenase YgiN